ncbi:HdeD family acid-resistance protein [Dictyobacter arantiisoli]|uniref:Membrane protein n=1 Tax=Dictyobacter arantiisoli TaxID=2014874 RepID=A0A5A5TBG9_9CHLR|nr:HdeD family acid-resistance protein [Dictyobacter arantiisoli]GCF08707.1 membrane protein [Dictyobacter arantiisoli]
MNPSVNTVQRSWGALLVRGVLAIIFGIIVLAIPGIALLALIIVFGAYALIDGVMAVVAAIQERDVLPRWKWLLVEGVVSIILGIVAFVWPGETALILLYIVAAWAIITGVIEVGAAFTTRNWMIGVAGLLSIIFGILLYARPGAGLLSLLWLLGVYAIVFGILFIVHAFQMRSRSNLMSENNRMGGFNA